MSRKLQVLAAIAAMLAFASPAFAESHVPGEPSRAPIHYDGIQKGEHILFHAQWTGFAIQQGIEQRSFATFWELFNAQTLCADDVPTELLFTPKGWGTGGAAIAVSFIVLWFRKRERRKWRSFILLVGLYFIHEPRLAYPLFGFFKVGTLQNSRAVPSTRCTCKWS